MTKMKSFGEMFMLNEAHQRQLQENTDEKRFLELNKGREGKPFVGLDGKENKGSAYLGNGSYAYVEGNIVRLIIAGGASFGKDKTLEIPKKIFDVLVKSKM